MKLVFAAILLAISATLVAAQPAATTGSPPAFKIVSKFEKDKGHVFILETVYKPVYVNVEPRRHRERQRRETHGNARKLSRSNVLY